MPARRRRAYQLLPPASRALMLFLFQSSGSRPGLYAAVVTLRFALILKIIKQRMFEGCVMSSQTRNRISRPPITKAAFDHEAAQKSQRSRTRNLQTRSAFVVTMHLRGPERRITFIDHPAMM